jgi:GABA(A) receptor-associated protein
MSSYKNAVSFNVRKEATKNILTKYPDKCPIYLTFDSKIVLKPRTGTNFNKYIISNALTVGQYLSILKKRIEMGESTGLTLFICIYKNDKLVNTILTSLSNSIEQVYDKYKDDDGFLYMNLVAENTFG